MVLLIMKSLWKMAISLGVYPIFRHTHLLFTTLATQSQPQPSSAIPQWHSRARLAILFVSCVLSESALLEVDSLVLSAVCNKTEQDHCLVILWSRSLARLLRKKNNYKCALHPYWSSSSANISKISHDGEASHWKLPACWIMDSRGSAELVSSLPFVRFAACKNLWLPSAAVVIHMEIFETALSEYYNKYWEQCFFLIVL